VKLVYEMEKDSLIHDVYKWEVDMNARHPKITVIEVEQPPAQIKYATQRALFF